MPIRLSGLISGMDTDALVQELVSAYSIKKDNYVKAQTKLDWQMDAWKALNTKVYDFYTKSLSNLRFSNAYSIKAVSVSDSTIAKVSGSTSAVNGDQSLAVNKLATTGYLTGAKLNSYTDADGNTQKVTTKTKLSDLNTNIGNGVINVKVDGKEKNIDVTGDMTVAQFVVKLKEAGLNASFDETNQRMFISAKESGKDHDFSLTGNGGGVEALKALGIFAVSEADKSQYTVMAGYTDEQLENFALNEYLKNQIDEANKTYTDKNAELTAANNDLKSKVSYANLTSSARAKTYMDVKTQIEALEQAKTDKPDEWTEEQQKKLDSYNKTMDMYNAVNAELGITITEGTDAEGLPTVTASEVDKDVLKAYVENISGEIDTNKAAIDENNKAVEANNKLLEKTYTTDELKAIEFTKYGETDKFTLDGYETSDAYMNIYSKYEDMRTNAQNIINSSDVGLGLSDAVRIGGGDAEIVLNGATFTSNTNNFSINGLTITATGVTEPGKDVTITTTTDVDGVYNMIKDYLKSYNELIKEMDTLFGAPSAKGYEPLTDEEKEAMSDKEVEKWETKIKDSLLRRDTTLDGVINSMKVAMSESFEIDGKKYSLSSFGISTLGYFSSGENEKGVYHIDGDSDDSSTSGNADKLKAMIASEPDVVTSFFTKLTNGLYDNLTNKMASSTVSSAYTIYNDKAMKKKYDEYDDTIDKWEEKLTAIEEKYYKQFSAMETAMAKLQSSTSALSSLMGS